MAIKLVLGECRSGHVPPPLISVPAFFPLAAWQEWRCKWIPTIFQVSVSDN